MNVILLNASALAILLGWPLLTWDHNSNAPGKLFGFGIVCMIVGKVLS